MVHFNFSVNRELFDKALLCFLRGRGESKADILKIQGCLMASTAVIRCDVCTVSIDLTRSLQELEILLQPGDDKLNCPRAAASNIFSLLSCQNGGYPATRRWSRTPPDQISTGRPIGLSRIVSGAKNIGAPRAGQHVTSAPRGSWKANPKSHSLMASCCLVLLSESGTCLTSMLSGLTSRWTMRFLWR